MCKHSFENISRKPEAKTMKNMTGSSNRFDILTWYSASFLHIKIYVNKVWKPFMENRKCFWSKPEVGTRLYFEISVLDLLEKSIICCHQMVSKLLLSIFWKTGSTNIDFRSKLGLDDRLIETGIVYLVGRDTQTIDIWPQMAKISIFLFSTMWRLTTNYPRSKTF